tara:strand:- start:113 stop:787 length:675 start_codon:yes stop_codon:yes gene_type:complete
MILKNFYKIFLGFLLTGLAIGQTAYVTDEISITARSGESSEYRIIGMLKSGTKVKVIEKNKETGYTKVVLPNGKEGFILSRQLLKTPVARDQLSELKAEILKLTEKPSLLEKEIQILTKKNKELKRSYEDLKKNSKKQEEELMFIKRSTKNITKISIERNQLKKQTAELLVEVEELKQKIYELENQSDQKWFAIGGAVVVLGVIIGLILPKLRFRRRKDSWGSL